MVHWRSRRRLSLLRTRRMRISDAAGQWCFAGIHVSNKTNAPVIRPGAHAQSRFDAVHLVLCPLLGGVRGTKPQSLTQTRSGMVRASRAWADWRAIRGPV